jgi:TP901 family phage tail tape measure protein
MSKQGGIKAGQAYVELSMRDGVTEPLRRAEKRMELFGEKVKEIGSAVAMAGAAVAAFGGAIVGAAAASVAAFAKIAGDFSDIAAQTGLTVELMSELETALKDAGSSVEEFSKSVVKMRRFISEAADGSKGAAEALGKLGLSASDLINLSADDQFLKIADALSQVKNPTDRLALAMELFGKSAYKMLPVLEAGGAGIEEFRRKAREMGFSLSGETADSADALGTQIEVLQDQFKRIAVVIGEALLPVAQAFVAVMQGLVGGVIEFIRENQGLVLGVTAAGAALLAVGTAIGIVGAGLVTFGVLISTTSTVLGFLAAASSLVATTFASTGAVVTAVSAAWAATATVATAAWTAGAAASAAAMAGGAGIAASAWAGVAAAASTAWGAISLPIPVIIGGVLALGAAIAYATGLLGAVADAFGSLWDIGVETASGLVSAWQGVTDAIAGGDWALAGEIAVKGLEVALRRGLEGIFQEIMLPFVTKVADLLSNIPGLSSLGDLARGLRIAGASGLLGLGGDEAQVELDALTRKARDARQEAERAKRSTAPDLGPSSPAAPALPALPALPEVAAPALPDLAPAQAEIQARMSAMGGFNAAALGGMFGGADEMVAQQKRGNDYLAKLLEQGKRNRDSLVWS